MIADREKSIWYPFLRIGGGSPILFKIRIGDRIGLQAKTIPIISTTLSKKRKNFSFHQASSLIRLHIGLWSISAKKFQVSSFFHCSGVEKLAAAAFFCTTNSKYSSGNSKTTKKRIGGRIGSSTISFFILRIG